MLFKMEFHACLRNRTWILIYSERGWSFITNKRRTIYLHARGWGWLALENVMKSFHKIYIVTVPKIMLGPPPPSMHFQKNCFDKRIILYRYTHIVHDFYVYWTTVILMKKTLYEPKNCILRQQMHCFYA